MEQVLPARFAVAAIQHEEVTALAQAAGEDFLAHDVPGVRNVHANKDDRNDLSFGVFNRLILGDIAFAKQQRQSAVDFPSVDGGKGRAGGIQHGAHRPLAILFTQGGGYANKVITAAYKQRRNGSRTVQELVRQGVVLMQSGITAFQKRDAESVNRLSLGSINIQWLR